MILRRGHRVQRSLKKLSQLLNREALIKEEAIKSEATLVTRQATPEERKKYNIL
jgi:hypothetical protein